MDGLKLKQWIEDFNAEIKQVEVQFNTFAPKDILSDYYTLELNETSDELSVVIKSGLPNEFENKIQQILIQTKPEDSV